MSKNGKKWQTRFIEFLEKYKIIMHVIYYYEYSTNK